MQGQHARLTHASRQCGPSAASPEQRRCADASPGCACARAPCGVPVTRGVQTPLGFPRTVSHRTGGAAQAVHRGGGGTHCRHGRSRGPSRRRARAALRTAAVGAIGLRPPTLAGPVPIAGTARRCRETVAAIAPRSSSRGLRVKNSTPSYPGIGSPHRPRRGPRARTTSSWPGRWPGPAPWTSAGHGFAVAVDPVLFCR